MSKIVVYDNGDGFSRSDARTLFGNLGGSWKRHIRQTKRNHRMIHGQEGRGRYKAFALGQSVTWKVCYDEPSGRKAFEVRLLEADLGAQMIVRVAARVISRSCPRYIPTMQFVEPSPYVPRPDEEPVEPAWKSFDIFKDDVHPRQPTWKD